MGDYIRHMTDMQQWGLVVGNPLPVVVQLSASWHPPCKNLRGQLEALVTQLGGKVVYVYVDIEEVPVLAGMLQVHNVPHVFAFKGGKIAEQFAGQQSDEFLKAFLEKLL